jgi:hypothetical protein
MHWSKTRHVQFENCPRSFFYEVIAAPQNPKINALGEKITPPLARHEAIRGVVTRIVQKSPWVPEELPVMLAEARAQLITQLGNEFDANTQMSIVEACVKNFVELVLPEISKGKIVYVMQGDPVEFMYGELSVMASPELVVDCGDRIDIYQFKSGSPGFGKDKELHLKGGGLTCWARVALGEVKRPVRIVDVYLRSKPPATKHVTLNDESLNDFVGYATEVVGKYGVSAKIADFPATPGINTCRFCNYKPICPEYGAYAEASYDLGGLSKALDDVTAAKATALEKTHGEVRQVFLSHVSDDKEEFVRPFARALKAANITHWLDEAELMWGDSLVSGLNTGLATSDYVVAFITEAFLQRGWTKAELNASIVAHVKGKKRVLPIFIGDRDKMVEEYPLLKDILGKSWDEGIPELVKELQRVLGKKG